MDLISTWKRPLWLRGCGQQRQQSLLSVKSGPGSGPRSLEEHNTVCHTKVYRSGSLKFIVNANNIQQYGLWRDF